MGIPSLSIDGVVCHNNKKHERMEKKQLERMLRKIRGEEGEEEEKKVMTWFECVVKRRGGGVYGGAPGGGVGVLQSPAVLIEPELG